MQCTLRKPQVDSFVTYTRQGHTDAIEAMIADGVYLLSGGCDGTVRVWNVSCLAFEGDLCVFPTHSAVWVQVALEDNGLWRRGYLPCVGAPEL